MKKYIMVWMLLVTCFLVSGCGAISGFKHKEGEGVEWMQGYWAAVYRDSNVVGRSANFNYGRKLYKSQIIEVVDDAIRVDRVTDKCIANWDILSASSAFSHAVNYDLAETIVEGSCDQYVDIKISVSKRMGRVGGISIKGAKKRDPRRSTLHMRIGRKFETLSEAKKFVQSEFVRLSLKADGSRLISRSDICEKTAKAIVEGNVEQVQFAIESVPVDVEDCRYKGKSLTYISGYEGNNEITQALIGAGGQENDAISGLADHNQQKNKIAAGDKTGNERSAGNSSANDAYNALVIGTAAVVVTEAWDSVKSLFTSSGSSSTSSAYTSNYGCKFCCEGQFGLCSRNSERQVNTPSTSESEAEKYVRENYKKQCAEYPFYSGGGGSASVSLPSCKTYYYQD